MSWLAAYRRQLADEAAGRSHRFGDILRYFRVFWYVTIGAAVALSGWGIWLAMTQDLSGGKSVVLIMFLVGAIAIVLAGAVPYNLAKLFLSVTPTSGHEKDG